MSHLPVRQKKQGPPLWEQILDFKKNKIIWAIVLLIIAALGIVIPIIPGILIVILIIALFKKGWMEKLRSRFRFWKIKDQDDS